jgi:hypothetical protein
MKAIQRPTGSEEIHFVKGSLYDGIYFFFVKMKLQFKKCETLQRQAEISP